MTDMACDELVQVVTDYLEDDLSGADRARLEAHLPDCPFCADYVEQMRATVARLRYAGGIESLSPEARAGLLAAFRSGAGDGPGPPPLGE